MQLETDSDILVQKAEMALNKYRMNVVVANLLATYKEEVVVISNGKSNTIRRCNKDEDLEGAYYQAPREEPLKVYLQQHRRAQ